MPSRRELLQSLARLAVGALFDLSPTALVRGALKEALRLWEKEHPEVKVDPAAVLKRLEKDLEPYLAREVPEEVLPAVETNTVLLLERHALGPERINDLGREPPRIVQEILGDGKRVIQTLSPDREIPVIAGLLRFLYDALLKQQPVLDWLRADLERRHLVAHGHARDAAETGRRVESKLDVVIEGTTRVETLLEETLRQGASDEAPPAPGSPDPLHPPRFESEVHERMATRLLELQEEKAILRAEGGDTSALVEEIVPLQRALRSGPDLKAGVILGDRFRLLDLLGRGGFSSVWRAVDLHRRKVVAVKVLRGDRSADRSVRERFFRGARAMAGLDHPGVLRIFVDEAEDDGYLFFVMEYAAGGDLRRAVLEQRIDRGAALEAVLTVAEAVQYAHDRGVVHRDIKPANILFTQDGRPKLTDFDLVRVLDSSAGTHTHAMIGTLLYAAPESLADGGQAHFPADVYSLGMTLAFVFHGKDLPLDLLYRSEEFLSKLPAAEAVRRVLLRATRMEPGERWESARELAMGMRKALEAPAGSAILDDAPSVESAAPRPATSTIGAVVPGLVGADGLDLFDLDSEAWVDIPGGTFWMGAQAEDPKGRGYDPLAFEDESPVHRVTVSPFRLSRYPVTNAEYQVFVRETGREPPQHWKDGRIPEGKERHPVVYVSWWDAVAFCEWFTQRIRNAGGKAEVRLPREAEWEFAARGEEGRRYPWGDEEPTQERANHSGTVGSTTPVGSYPEGATPRGVLDLAGNVWQWCADWKGRYGTEPETDPTGPKSGASRVLRGGSFRSGPRNLRAAYRYDVLPEYRNDHVGFRVLSSVAGGLEP